MNELTVVDKTAEWRRMKALVLDSVSSSITKRVYNMALDEFFSWYAQEPRPGFTKATVSAWRVSLEQRRLGSSSIIIRMSAIRKLAVEATDNGLLAPEIAAGIQRVKSAKSIGVRAGNWRSLKQAQALLNAPDITTTKGLRDRQKRYPEPPRKLCHRPLASPTRCNIDVQRSASLREGEAVRGHRVSAAARGLRNRDSGTARCNCASARRASVSRDPDG